MIIQHRHLAVRIASAVVVFAVIGWLGYEGMSRVHRIVIVANPETLPPDGHAEAVVELQAKNLFGVSAWRKPTARFQIAEGNNSGRIVGVSSLSVRIRSTRLAGRIVLHVFVQGYPMPYEIVIPVRPNYAVFMPPERRRAM